jgi:alpha-tubulin suppressor-like RCC1 family protein
VATVSSSGVVTPIAVGTTTITATQATTPTHFAAVTATTFRVVESNRARRVAKNVQSDNFGMILSNTGQVWRFGWGGYGLWTQFAGDTYADISVGGQEACAITTLGALRCVQYFWSGTSVARVMTGFESGTKSVSAGPNATCAVKVTGELLCWGNNGQGQVGNGTTVNQSTPVPILNGVSQVVSGIYHSCAIMTDTTVRCWGANWSGQVGDGTTQQRNSPVIVPGLSGVTSIAANFESTCAVVAGAVKCWGGNAHGELGSGTGLTTPSMVPVAAVGLESGQRSVTTGGRTACALSLGGAVKCWGANRLGSVGDGTYVDKTSPVAIPELQSDIIAVQMGNETGCAVTEDLLQLCWGGNYSGQLANGERRNNRPSPVWARGT